MRTLRQILAGFVPPRIRKRLHMESRSSKPPRGTNRPSSPDSEGTSEPSAAPKSKSKFGAFRTSLKEVGQRVGGRVKPADPEAAAVKAKEKDRKKVKKLEKSKSKASKREGSAEESPAADGAEATPSPAKTARTSKASTLVRKLSIGRYKGGDGGKNSKTPTPEASPSASSASSSRQAPDGEDLSSPGTPPTPPVRQPEPLLPPDADQSGEAAAAGEGPVTEPRAAADSLPTAPEAAATAAELVQEIVWNLTPEPAADPPAPPQQQQSEPAAKDGGAAEAEPKAADVADLRAPPLVASVSATVRDVAARQVEPLESEHEEELDQFGEVESEAAQTESGRVTPAAESAVAAPPVQSSSEETIEQRVEQEQPSAPPQPEQETPLEAAEEKPQPPQPQDSSAEGSEQVDTAVVQQEQEAQPAASDSEAEDSTGDMSQRRNRKRQSGAAAASALSPGAADGPDNLPDSQLPSLKAELATAADKERQQRESDASDTFLDAERADGALHNGTGDEEFAQAEDERGSLLDATSIGDAIAEARSKLTESLGAAAAAASQQSPSPAAQQLPEKREHLYKILVIGELGTGKTSIIKRYVHQFFSQHYRATIGVDFALKVLNWDSNTIIRLQMWDIAGQERFGNMTRVYYKEAVGAFIVFDVTRVATFDAVMKWKQDLDSKVTLQDGSPIPCVLLANKCDQPKEGLVNNPAKMEEYCKEKGFTAWYETSAKENINIDEAARTLVKKILQNDQLIHQNDTAKDTEKIALDGKASEAKSGRCSC
ncbi:fibrous sheath CABYR-binding protein-like isoform X2 [Schistocerca nitens]|uniref:fibrous sheath CABYR-binding protein-like isoform X2 n=1 Tax=Schistocerca nitens TaxID=7011 RepID=UPI0021174308|nr:fibrous sheath CABYR-binding protein-like isoform X2 [Schistocerca nitens]